VGRIFGTDGVRGVANRDLTAELALDLSVAAAHVLGEAGAFAGHRPVALVGRDTRASGEFLEAAMVAGLASAGVDVWTLGVLPTPGVAHLTGYLGADLAVMISASHNPMPDNGIKFFAKGGHKLDDVIEDAIESRLREPWQRPVGTAVGRVRARTDMVRSYVDHLVSTIGHPLRDVRVVLDCANGAASEVAPMALAAAGAKVVTIHDAPDGLNINDECGSTHMGDLQAAVVDSRADIGFAFDGDADRCLAVDAAGELVDGDQILLVLALAMREAGTLEADTVVATIMSNLGFVQALQRESITLQQTAVGDRYVLEAMKAGAFTLGGEQSGHVIMSDYATTGDGVLTALHIAERMATTRCSIQELAAAMTRLPQVMVNVPDVNRDRASTDPRVAAAVADAEARLGGSGRVLLRPSGTEPLVRVMVEATSQAEAQQVADQLAEKVREHLGR